MGCIMEHEIYKVELFLLNIDYDTDCWGGGVHIWNYWLMPWCLSLLWLPQRNTIKEVAWPKDTHLLQLWRLEGQDPSVGRADPS